MAAYLTECPHCKRMVGNRHFDGRCPADPAVHDVIGALLADPDMPGVARSTAAYVRARNAAGVDVPNDTVIGKFYGSWAAVCEHYGLVSPATALTACPYCGMTVRVTHAHLHTRVCPDNPDMRALMIAVLTDGCEPGEAVGIAEYNDRRLIMDPGPADPDSLYSWAGSTRWCDVLAKLGLVQRKRTARRVSGEALRFARVTADVAQELEENARLIAAERYGDRGIAVCGDPERGDPRPVPGLRTANGRECVAYVVR